MKFHFQSIAIGCQRCIFSQSETFDFQTPLEEPKDPLEEPKENFSRCCMAQKFLLALPPPPPPINFLPTALSVLLLTNDTNCSLEKADRASRYLLEFIGPLKSLSFS